jgi:hypothetical protein
MSVSDSHDEANIQDAAMACLLKVLPIKLASGDRWVFAPEIFWKARGDQLEFTAAAIACVFKKLYGVNARR